MKKAVIIILSSCALVKASAQTGIGTTAPVNKLHIEATTVDPATSGSSANGNLRLSGSGASHVLDFGLSSSSNFSWLQARSKSNYSTNYNLLLNPNGGLVGIGTTSPFTTLTVGNTAGTVSGEITINPQATLNEGGQITIKKSLNGSTADWTIDQYGTTSSNARLRIFGGNSETNGITILENGNVGIGTPSPARKLHVQTADQTSVYIESTTSDNNGMMILNANTNQNWANGWHEFLMFQNQGNTIGQVVQTNASTINYATTSDYRLKTDFKSFKGLDIVNKIKIYDYAWKIDSSRMYGVKAHELQQVLPYLVSGKKDEVDKDGKLIPQTVDYGKLTPILVKAIQEQDSVIKNQGAQIQNLKREKEMIEKRLSDMELIIKKIVKKQTN